MKQFTSIIALCTLVLIYSCGGQKRYVSYKVKKGETMRDIAKRLNIETKDLVRLNPNIGTQPDENTIIVIPNTKQVKKVTPVTTPEEKPVEETTSEEETKEAEETANTDENEEDVVLEKIVTQYITHTVQPKETVYKLTRLYNLSAQELRDLNPEYPDLKDNKLAIGQILKVKKIEKKVVVSKGKYVTHEVKPKETLYSLTRFYNVTDEDLFGLNPSLRENGLKAGETIKVKIVGEKEKVEEALIYQDTIAIERPIQLAMLLPFRASEYESTYARDIFRKNKLANMVADFYLGAEIAIDSIKKQGINVITKVFDTGKRGANTPTILEENDLNGMDAVIGPFYSDQVNIVTNKVKAPVIFPHFSSNQEEFSSAKLIKSASDMKTRADFLTSYLKEQYNGENIFIATDEEPTFSKTIESLVSEFKKHDSINEVFVLKPEKGYIDKERFTEVMKPKSRNWLIIVSQDNVLVADALNSMMVIPDDGTAQVFALEKTSAYDKIDNNKLARVGFTYTTNEYSDESSTNVKVFNKKYRKKNNTLPSDYATRGFDITYDTLMRLASGNNLKDTFKKGASMRLETLFDYNKKFLGATSNNGLFLVKYTNNLSLERLK